MKSALLILLAFVIVAALARWLPQKPTYACLGPYWDSADPKTLQSCRDTAKAMHFETTKP
jgi:hypothetical protein